MGEALVEAGIQADLPQLPADGEVRFGQHGRQLGQVGPKPVQCAAELRDGRGEFDAECGGDRGSASSRAGSRSWCTVRRSATSFGLAEGSGSAPITVWHRSDSAAASAVSPASVRAAVISACRSRWSTSRSSTVAGRPATRTAKVSA
ncbi:hypothetical protein GCM10025734_74480 [Kitasatospora paranensis]